MAGDRMDVQGYVEADTARATYFAREAWRPQWNAPGAREPGQMRGICRGLQGTHVAAGMVIIPAGQETPDHWYTGEHIVFQLRGSTRFVVDGEEFVLRPQDAIFLPANVVYRYGSVGLEESVFVNILGRVDEWPGTSHYVER